VGVSFGGIELRNNAAGAQIKFRQICRELRDDHFAFLLNRRDRTHVGLNIQFNPGAGGNLVIEGNGHALRGGNRGSALTGHGGFARTNQFDDLGVLSEGTRRKKGCAER
jgi:hypothetical protein